MTNRFWLGIFIASMATIPGWVQAERADREQPVKLEADKVTVDDKQKLHLFEGSVQLTQGTLVIRTSRLQVTQDQEGFQKGIAHGGADGLARFRQRREGTRAEFVDGEAERIEHNNRTEKTEFFGRARVKSGQDEVSGQYISYDGKTENYVVTNGANGATVARTGSGPQERVRAVIQPKNKNDDAAAASRPASTPAPAPTSTPTKESKP